MCVCVCVYMFLYVSAIKRVIVSMMVICEENEMFVILNDIK